MVNNIKINDSLSRWEAFGAGFLSETMPAPCAACGVEVPVKHGFCEACHSLLPLIFDDDRCPACGAENDGIFDFCSKCLKEDERPWVNAVAVMRMQGLGSELIHRFKYGNETSLARSLGELAAAAILNSGLDADLIVPVPLHWSRALSRGYNQTRLLCGIISKETGIPMRSILRRTRATPKQASLGRERRKKNLVEAFAVRSQSYCEGRKILLVDDVFTTGSTLIAAAETLNKSGAAQVSILTLVRA